MIDPNPNRKLRRSSSVMGRSAGHGVVQLTVDGPEDPAVCELGQQVVYGPFQIQYPVLDQGQSGHCGDRLGE
jgi:hypothetical protein